MDGTRNGGAVTGATGSSRVAGGGKLDAAKNEGFCAQG